MREYRIIALSGVLSNNLDTIGHSEMCHPIQNHAIEHQLFELIINLAGLQPIAEDRLETEDLSLRQASAMIVGEAHCSPVNSSVVQFSTASELTQTAPLPRFLSEIYSQ